MDSQNFTDIGEFQVYASQLEGRIGRQAMTIEQLQGAVAQSHAEYTNLMRVMAQIKSGDIALDRFLILPDGLTWQVLALPEATAVSGPLSVETTVATSTTESEIPQLPTAD